MGRIDVPASSDFPGVADMVIIGGGIVGAATAFHATREGLKTIVLEKREGLATLTTTISLECFRAQFIEPENIAMMKASIEMFENFAAVVGLEGYDIGLHQWGYLFPAREEEWAEVLRERVDAQHGLGLDDVEYLTGDEARNRFPYLAPEVIAAAYRARDGWMSSHEATYGFAKGSTADFYLSTEATDILVEKGKVAGVMTNRGRVDCRTVVIAAGPFSGQVAKMAGVDLPVELIRRHKTIIGEHPLIPHDAPMTIDIATGAHWRPEGPGAAVGAPPMPPEEPGEPMDQVPTDWTFPAMAIDVASVMAPFWNEVAETLTKDNVFLSAGQYTCTADNKPILGPHPEVEGLFINAGYSGHGVMASPGGSRQVVDMILGHIPQKENPFRFERFTEGVVGGESMVF